MYAYIINDKSTPLKLCEYFTQATGRVVWNYDCPKPFFSSPNLLSRDGTMAIGCVNGEMHVVEGSGQLVSAILQILLLLL